MRAAFKGLTPSICHFLLTRKGLRGNYGFEGIPHPAWHGWDCNTSHHDFQYLAPLAGPCGESCALLEFAALESQSRARHSNPRW